MWPPIDTISCAGIIAFMHANAYMHMTCARSCDLLHILNLKYVYMRVRSIHIVYMYSMCILMYVHING